MVRWIATRLHGDGTETVVADELPVTGGQVQRALSGPGGVSGTIPVEVARLQGTRAAAEQAMLAAAGKVRIETGDVAPPGDDRVLWLQGPGRVPHVYVEHDGAEEWVNRDPGLAAWTLNAADGGSAEYRDGVIRLRGYGSYAQSPLIPLDGADMARHALRVRTRGTAEGRDEPRTIRHYAYFDADGNAAANWPNRGSASSIITAEDAWEWQYFNTRTQPPDYDPHDPPVAYFRLRLALSAQWTGDNVDLAGAHVYFGDDPTPGVYFDGETLGFQWDGERYASTSSYAGPGWYPMDDPALEAAAQIEHERILVPGITGLYCLTDAGTVLGGGILTADSGREGHQYVLDAAGHAAFPARMPYDGNEQWVQVDPADLIRHAWTHVQAQPQHNLGVTVDDTATPVRVGTEEEDVEFTTGSGERVEFEAGPVKWNYWTTHDLAREINTLAADTPLDYTMTHAWDGATVHHRLRLGYPRLGRRRTDLTFTVGVNVIAEPAVTTALDVSRVLVLGAGEGSAARRGWATRTTGALGRTVVLTDKALTSNGQCVAAAQRHLDWLTGTDEVSTLTVIDHPNAPLATWVMGDDIRVQGSGAGWAGDLDMWVRILSDEIDPDTGTAVLTVTRAERSTR